MKSLNKWLLILATASCVALFSTNANAETNTVTSTVTGTTTVDKTPPTASAPNVMINNQDVCSTGTSAAVQTQVFGIAGGTTIRDRNCERLKLSRALYGMGIEGRGRFPYFAKIQEYLKPWRWQEHLVLTKARLVLKPRKHGLTIQKNVPDYDKWLKENDLEDTEKEWKNKATTWGFGLGSLGLLLFLL